MKALTEQEERRLLQALRDSRSAVRDYALIHLVLSTGLRVAEVRGLNIHDVFDGQSIQKRLVVRKDIAKRRKTREIPLHTKIRSHMAKYLRWRQQTDRLTMESPLFISRLGKRMGQRTVQDLVERWYVRAGIGHEGYGVHTMRHSFAMKLRRRGVRLEVIQRLLGHASLQSTGIYLEPCAEDLVNATALLHQPAPTAVAVASESRSCSTA